MAKIFSDCSHNTGEFENIDKMQIGNIESKNGIYFVMSINMFTSWIKNEYKTDKDEKSL